MNRHPIVLFESVFKWLNQAIAEHGLNLYIVTVWLSSLLITWVLRRSLSLGQRLSSGPKSTDHFPAPQR